MPPSDPQFTSLGAALGRAADADALGGLFAVASLAASKRPAGNWNDASAAMTERRDGSVDPEACLRLVRHHRRHITEARADIAQRQSDIAEHERAIFSLETALVEASVPFPGAPPAQSAGQARFLALVRAEFGPGTQAHDSYSDAEIIAVYNRYDRCTARARNFFELVDDLSRPVILDGMTDPDAFTPLGGTNAAPPQHAPQGETS